MARRGKTVIGGGSQAQSRTMMQAAESGNSARQRATEGLTQQSARGNQEGARMGQMAAQQANIHEDRNLRRQGMEAQQAATSRSQDLQEAQAGFTRAPELEQRSQQLEAEMGRGTASGLSPEQSQNLQEQGQKPLEIGGQGATQPGELRQSELGKRRETRADFQAETARLNAQANFTRTQNKALQAQFAGDKEGVKLIKTELNSKLDQQQNLFTRMMNGDPRPNDFATLQKWAQEEGGLDDMQDGGQLAEILKSGQAPVDPESQKRLQGFMQSYMDRNAMKYAMTLGEIPGEFVDFSGPVMQKFGQAAQEVSAIMKMAGPAFQQFNGIRSQADKIRFTNRMAAGMVMSGVASTGMGAPGQEQEMGAEQGVPEFDDSLPPGAGMPAPEPEPQEQGMTPVEDYRRGGPIK